MGGLLGGATLAGLPNEKDGAGTGAKGDGDGGNIAFTSEFAGEVPKILVFFDSSAVLGLPVPNENVGTEGLLDPAEKLKEALPVPLIESDGVGFPNENEGVAITGGVEVLPLSLGLKGELDVFALVDAVAAAMGGPKENGTLSVETLFAASVGVCASEPAAGFPNANTGAVDMG